MKIQLSLFLMILLTPFLALQAQEETDPDSVITPVPVRTAWQDPRFSVEPYFTASYHVIHSPDWLYVDRIRYPNSWSMGGGLLLSKYFNDLRISAGIAYSQLEYWHKFQTAVEFNVDRIEILQIPVFISYNKKFFSPFLGVVINRPYAYNMLGDSLLQAELNTVTWYPNAQQGQVIPPDEPLYHRFGWSATLMAGMGFRFSLTRWLNFRPSFHYAYKAGYDLYLSSYREPEHQETLFDGHSSFGLSMSLEFVANARR